MSYLKLILLWLLGTLIIYILIATSIMFSRITTLEGVKIFDFKIYVKLIEEIGTDKIDTLINVSNSLTYNSRNYYPIAVITKEKCLENGLGNSNICTNFNSISSLEKFLSNFTPIDKNGDTKSYKAYYYPGKNADQQDSNGRIQISYFGSDDDYVSGSFTITNAGIFQPDDDYSMTDTTPIKGYFRIYRWKEKKF